MRIKTTTLLTVLCLLGLLSNAQISTGGRTIGVSGITEEINDVLLLDDGSAVVTGTIQNQVMLVRLDSNKIVQWNTATSASSQDAGLSTVLMDSGNLLTVGGANSEVGGFNKHIYLSIVDLNGNLVNQKVIGNATTFISTGCEAIGSDQYIIYGIGSNGAGFGPSFIVVDGALNVITNSLYSNPDAHLFHKVTATPDGNLIFTTGRFFGESEGFYGKMDPSGNILWMKSITETVGGTRYPAAALISANGTYVYVYHNWHSGEGSYFIIYETDAAGNMLNSYEIVPEGAEETVYINDAIITDNNTLLMTSATNSLGTGQGKLVAFNLDTEFAFSRKYNSAINHYIDGNAGGEYVILGESGDDMALLYIDETGANLCSEDFRVEQVISPARVIENAESYASETPLAYADSSSAFTDAVYSYVNIPSCADEEISVSTFFNTYQKTSDGMAGSIGATDLIISSTGGALLTGNATGWGSGNQDGYGLSIDADGEISFSNAYGTNGNEKIMASVKHSGGTVLAMTTDNCSTCTASQAMVLVSIDELGIVEWQVAYDQNQGLTPYSIIENSSGNFVIAGSVNTTDEDAFFMEVDATGSIVQQYRYSGGSDDVFNDIIELSSGNYLAVGYTETWGAGNKSVLAVELSSSGNKIWENTYAYNFASYDQYATAAAELSTGNYMLTGYVEGLIGDLLLLEIDNTGSVVWAKADGHNVNQTSPIANSIHAYDDGGFIVGGHVTNLYFKDLFAIKYDAAKTREWGYKYGGDNKESAGKLAFDPLSGGFYLGGTTESYNNRDYLLLKADSLGYTGDCHQDTLEIKRYNMTPQVVASSLTRNTMGTTIVSTAIVQSGSQNELTDLKMTLNLTASDVSCFGDTDGELSAHVVNGAAPIVYGWSSGDVGQTADDLAPGTYEGYVTDDFGCFLSDSITISEPAPMTATINSTNVTCHGGSNGTATVNVAGGTEPFTYFWSNGFLQDSTYNLLPGNYSVNIFDVNNCLASGIVTITEPDALSYSISSTNNVCNGASNGSIVVTASNGTAPYSFIWDDGPTSANRSSLLAGTYYITISDACGESFYDSVVITEPTALAGTTVITDVSCFGGSDAEVEAVASGGTPPYSYSWSASTSTSATIIGQPAGSESATITDACGAFVIVNYTVNQPTVLTTSTGAQDVSCFGGNDGVAYVVPTGGTTPYSYFWSNGLITDTITNLYPGTYTVNVLDANGCLSNGLVSIGEPDQLQVMHTSTNNTCFSGSNGQISILVSDGTAPYSFSWLDGPTDSTRTGLSSGTYHYTVTDNCLASHSDSVIISQPDSMVVTLNVSDVLCNGGTSGSVSTSISGGTAPFSYSWAINGSSASSISGQPAGSSSVSVVDACGQNITLFYTIAEPALFTVNVSTADAQCFGSGDGSATANVSGGTAPYIYLWNTGHNISMVNGLFAGTYTVSVTDSNGCFASNSGVISQPSALDISFQTSDATCNGSDGEVIADVTGGTMPYGYSWAGSGSTNDTVSGAMSGTYTLTVTDNNGCVVADSASIGTTVDPVEICVVTVDTLNQNVLNWAKPIASNLAGFNIYRNIAGSYQQIGFRDYDSLSYYIDTDFGVDPTVTSYRYKISAVDTCGNESDLSDFHETIHLTSNVGVGGEVNLIWDNYEGFSFGFYYILRDSTFSNNWQTLDSVSPTNFTYTDLNVPAIGAAYAIQVATPILCDATKAVGDFNSSRSNSAQNAKAPTGIEELELASKVYPNPVKDQLTIEVSNSTLIELQLYDMQGRLVRSVSANGNSTKLDVQDLNTGMYLLRVITEHGSFDERITKTW